MCTRSFQQEHPTTKGNQRNQSPCRQSEDSPTGQPAKNHAKAGGVCKPKRQRIRPKHFMGLDSEAKRAKEPTCKKVPHEYNPIQNAQQARGIARVQKGLINIVYGYVCMRKGCMRMQESPGANAGKSPTSIIRSIMHNRQEEEPKCNKVRTM